MEAPTKSQPSLFEISINTAKFTEFTQTLNTILTEHQGTIQQHTREITHLKMLVEEKTSKLGTELQQEANKAERRRKEIVQTQERMAEEVKEMHKRAEYEHGVRIKELKDELDNANKKIASFGKTTREDLLRQLEKELSVQRTKMQAAL